MISDKKEIISILQNIKPALFSSYPIKVLGLFGSVVRDDFGKNSDIDILVDFYEPVGIEFIDLADELERVLQRKVDLVSKKGIKKKYLERIEKDLIYV